MTTVGIRALKQNASAVVAAAAAGEEVVITDRGRPVAMLVPLPTSRLAQLAAQGRLRPALGSLEDLPPPVRLPRGARSASEVLAEMRDDERY